MPESTTNLNTNPSARAAKQADDTPARHDMNARTHADAPRQSVVSDSGNALDVDAVMSRVRHEMAKRGAGTEGWFDPLDETVTGAHWRPAAPRLPDRDQFALADFLRFDDEDFVDVAYRTLLRRPANDEGSRSYLDALRHGAASKVEVLGSIRFSDEGRRHSVHVDGLLRPYKLHRWRRLPVIGWFLGMGMAVARLPRLALRLQGMEASSAHETQALGRWVNRIDAAVAKRLLHAEDDRHKLHGDLQALRGEFDKANAELAAATTRLESHESALAAFNDRVRNDQRSLRTALDRLSVFLDTMMQQRSDGGGPPVPDQARARTMEQHYASFEKIFRGERGEIKRRVAHYLGTLAAAGIQPGEDDIIIDLGSGRGEWLEVLAEHGFRGRGVDLNRGLLKESEALGHEVVEADVLAYLKIQDNDSIAAVTSMHMVEHLPHAILIQLLDESLRVLRPGGVLVLETPNPENVLVGSCRFYMDPTHLNPIPPPLLQWTVQACGFDQVTIERLSEHRGKPDLVPVAEDSPGAAQINQMIAWFTAAPDYAIVARKPATSETAS
jgi:O-antigen chain-terminating methyltransferase